MRKDIKKITLGIRYKRSFGISDNLGKMIDFILFSEDSPFKDFFPKVQNSPNGKTLVNDDASEYLLIDIDNLILSVCVKDKLEHSLMNITKKYYPFIKKLLLKFEVQNYNRLGIVFEHSQDKKEEFFSDKIKLITNSSIDLAENIEFRFSKKISIPEAEFKKDLNDYNNIIFSYIKDSEGCDFSLDYQKNFLPPITSVSTLELDKFIEASKLYLNNNFYNWKLNINENAK